MEDSKYITFEKYLSKELSDKELISFEKELASNADLKQDFEIYKSLNKSLSSKFQNEEGAEALSKTLSDLGSKYIKKDISTKGTNVISLIRFRKLMVAASIAFLIGFFLLNKGNPVYEDFSDHNTLELVVRGEHNETITKAEEAFNSGNYEIALKLLTSLTVEFSNDTEILLYKGICLLELSNYKEAGVIFDDISHGSSTFSPKATWYKALSLLKQQKYKDCKAVLQSIPESSSDYKEAQKLLKKL